MSLLYWWVTCANYFSYFIVYYKLKVKNLIQQSEKALLMSDSIGVLSCLKFFIKQAVKRLYLEKQYEDLVMKYL